MRRAAWAPLTLSVLAACTSSRRPSNAAVQGAAVREIFVTREHARRLVLWADPDEPGPTFELLGEFDARVDARALAAAIPTLVVPVRADDLARLFRTHPDGWAAFYTAYPGAPGLVELARPAWAGDTIATVVVGRACGEHCFNAWRATVRVVGHTVRVTAAVPLRLPKS